MTEQRNVPFVDGMDLGLGLDDLTGQVGSLAAVEFTASEATADSGQEATYDTTLINTAEQLYEQLDVKVTAEGRYGLFSAKGKFEFMDKSRFNQTATFLVAHATVNTAFVRAKNPVPVQDAAQLVHDGRTDLFRKRYGDLFIRGIQSGGEYIAIISITSEESQTEQKLAASLKASFDGIAASGSVAVDVAHEQSELRRRSEVRVSTYQRGGVGEAISYTGTIDEVIARLKSFAGAVHTNPKAYSIQAASYETLAFPDPPSPFSIAVAAEVLEECMKNRIKLQTARNDVAAVIEHPTYFESPPDTATLQDWSQQLTDSLNQLDQHVRTATEHVADATFIPFALPLDFAIPPRIRHSTLGAEVFTHADYADSWQDIPGFSQTLDLGSYDDAKHQLQIGNDQISSLKVPEGVGVRCYEHAWFQGAHIDFLQDTPKIPMDWNDRVSSLIVYRTQDGPPPPTNYVVATDAAWRSPLLLPPGNYSDLETTVVRSNNINYLLVPAGLCVQLWDEPGYAGETITITADTTDLGPWNDRASSMKVTAL